MPEYALTELSRVYLGFQICQDSEYHRVLNMQELLTRGTKYATIWPKMSKFTIIDRVLNMYYTIYSVRLLYKLMSTY